jgi:hypothetical protein
VSPEIAYSEREEGKWGRANARHDLAYVSTSGAIHVPLQKVAEAWIATED